MRLGSPHRRTRILFLGVLFVFSIFAAQLVRIQGIDAASVAAEAQKQRRATVAIPALRGQILSSDGVVLAASQERVTIVVDQTVVCTYRTRKADCSPETANRAIESAADDLSPLLDLPRDQLITQLSGRSRYHILVRQATPMTWRKVKTLGIPGLYQDARVDQGVSLPLRSYPQGPTAASLVGFVTQEGRGSGGVESLADRTLRGKVGQQSYEIGGNGEVIPAAGVTVTAAQNGQDVTLTINSAVQWYAQNALAQKVQETQALSGTIVVMDARTGDLLTVASYPTYDPNDTSKAPGTFVNQALGATFEPGSTAKLMVLASAMQEKTVTPDTTVIVPEQIFRGGFRIADAEPHPTEYRTVTGVLAQSSNMGTVLISETMSPELLEAHYRKFGVGEPTGIGFPGETSGSFLASKNWSSSQRATISYGQGLSMNAVQSAAVYQTIANGGVRIPPTLVAGHTEPDGTFVRTPQPKGVRVVDKAVADELSRMLEGVVSDQGTAPQAQIPGYRVAGKTGTADRFDAAAKGYSGKTASFIGFAPADDPQLVTAVILERPIKGYFGGTVAAPVFHDVMTFALQELKIPPTGAAPPKLTIDVDPAAAEADPHALRDTQSR